ncbi:MAG: hypothetical protein A2939_00080 [Parcubacteria group bacterium RIFCSPLOWO2_01_FULL_48_18]|nr:MAG: hypothetical protein A3J67_05970 [Parcubacteria group bacterium RIFCSPHIGHO2_02_FULL_48_10b]OHB22164.1 MAG: hypothetical protein A2939_00080 [Parcubacteria group bacterium RIFCSPLOWO2_01_FULL_48_18]
MASLSTILDIVLRAVAVYAVMLVGLRLSGKREIGQMTPFDFVLLLLIANAVQNAMVGSDTSLVGGIIAAGTLICINMIVTRLVWRSKKIQRLVEGSPTLLISDGKTVAKNLKKEKVTKEVLEEVLREHGVASVSDVKCAMLEVDGNISVIRFDEMPSLPRPHHRIRHVFKKP